MIEEFSNYIWVLIGMGGFIVGFWQFRKWNIEKLKQNNSNDKSKRKAALDIESPELQQYINNPEEAIKVLMADRVIKEKTNDKAGIDNIDYQIKGLQILSQIPKPMRPFAAKLGQTGMKKITSFVDSF